MSNETKGSRRARATLEFFEARDFCIDRGMDLRKNSDTHYSLFGDGWLLDIYPGNQRLYRPENREPRAPFLELPNEWGLLDVVKAATKGDD